MELPKNVRKKKETLCKDLEPVECPLFLGIQPSERRPFHSNQNKQGSSAGSRERYVLRGSSQDSFQWLIGPMVIVVEVPFFWIRVANPFRNMVELRNEVLRWCSPAYKERYVVLGQSSLRFGELSLWFGELSKRFRFSYTVRFCCKTLRKKSLRNFWDRWVLALIDFDDCKCHVSCCSCHYDIDIMILWVFPKMVVPNHQGFPTKNHHFGVVKWGYHYFRKHPIW